MKIFRSILFNLFSFFVGISLAWWTVFLLWQSISTTASIHDALDTKTQSQSDILFSINNDTLIVKSNRSFPVLNNQSFRIQLLYDESLDIKDRKIVSDFNYSSDIRDGVISVVLNVDNTRLNPDQELFRFILSPRIIDVSQLPQLESIIRYGNELMQTLSLERNAIL